MSRISFLISAALAAGGSSQDVYLRGGLPYEFGEIDGQERQLAGHGAFSYVIPCMPEPGGKNLVEPCGKVLPDGEDKTYDVHFGTKLFSFTLPGGHDEELAKEKWYTLVLAVGTLLLVVIPLVVLRFVNKPWFDALFGSVPRADKDPTITAAETVAMDKAKMDATGAGFIAPVNYYRCMAMLAIANPPDVSYVLWIKLHVMAILVAAVQVGTPIYLLITFSQRYQVIGVVPVFDLHPTELPTRILGLGLTILTAYKCFARKIEDAYGANMYIVSRKYEDPTKSASESPLPSPAGEERKLLIPPQADDDVPMKRKAIKHFWLSLSMALKMCMCLVTFMIALAEVSVLEEMDWSSIMTTLTALYIVTDLDVTAMSLDSELKDRYRNYVCRLGYHDASYHQDTQDKYTLMRNIFENIMQIASGLVLIAVPLLQFQHGDALIPSRLPELVE